MLPILPAILLLFLQGPANLERMAHEGRLPLAREAAQTFENRDERALAALLAASNSGELSSAILALIQWSEEKPKATGGEPIETFIPIGTRACEAVRDGFTTSQRSRDGPFAVV